MSNPKFFNRTLNFVPANLADSHDYAGEIVEHIDVMEDGYNEAITAIVKHLGKSLKEIYCIYQCYDSDGNSLDEIEAIEFARFMICRTDFHKREVFAESYIVKYYDIQYFGNKFQFAHLFANEYYPFEVFLFV